MKKYNIHFLALLLVASLNMASCSSDYNTPEQTSGETIPDGNQDENPDSQSLSSEKQIIIFTLDGQIGDTDINEEEKTISITIPFTSSLMLTPTITISENASIYPASTVKQDFSDKVIYTVTAEDGTMAEYTATIEKGASTQNGIIVEELVSISDEIITASFSLKGKGYAVTVNKHLYEYNPQTNSWMQKADFPGNDRSIAYGFADGDLGYYGLGYNGANGDYLTDIWNYNAENDLWTEITVEGINFTTYKPYGTAILVNNIIYGDYPGSGNTLFRGTLNSDTSSILWEDTGNVFPGGNNNSAMYFVLNDILYWGGHYLGNNIHSTEFYKYTPDTGIWEPLNDLPDGLFRHFQSYTFTIGNNAYTLNQDEIWKYDPLLDSWESITFINIPLYFETSFTIDAVSYILYADGTLYSFKDTNNN